MNLVENLAVAELLLVVFLITTGFVIGSFTTLNSIQGTQEKSTYNLSCPDPVVKVERAVEKERDELRASLELNNYIQNPETQVSYTKEEKSLEVEVDAVSRPEGMSMRPTIFTGNTVLLDKYVDEEIEAGQIIRYRSENGGHIIHRVRANYLDTEGYLLVKGDNTDTSERVEKGKVTHIVEGVLYT